MNSSYHGPPAVLLALLWLSNLATGRVVQLIAENPSAFVSTDPNDPKYIIGLYDDAAKAPQLAASTQSVRYATMADASGKRFNCSIPSSPAGLNTALEQQQQQHDPSSLQAAVVKTPFELLEALTALCLYRQDGLWTYEVCHRKHVRQFRQVSLLGGRSSDSNVIELQLDGNMDSLVSAVLSGDANKALGEVLKLETESSKKSEDFSCGQYTGDDQQDEVIKLDASSSGHPLKYVSHVYAGGASCVLTGQPRTAEVGSS
eukprot:GHRR01023686.1.p1 GENE.GHRR01023686.1~~GHRR01023686.1.p1  ORF type:complete len:259 (+),score=88.92 GHRR01023686.1:132-908(+)